jgi:hypothetical protein
MHKLSDVYWQFYLTFPKQVFDSALCTAFTHMVSSAFQSDHLYSNLIKKYLHLHSCYPRYWLYVGGSCYYYIYFGIGNFIIPSSTVTYKLSSSNPLPPIAKPIEVFNEF